MLFILYLLAVVNATDEIYIKRCLRSAEPWSTINNPTTLMMSADKCLARSYAVIPQNDRQPLKDHIQECLDFIRAIDLSRPEYKDISKSLTEITSNMGSSIVETQHTIARLSICTDPLRAIAQAEIFEEARFDSIVDLFTKNMLDTNACIYEMMNSIKIQTSDIEKRMGEYELAYKTWQGRTYTRHASADACRRSLHILMDDISHKIIQN